MKHFIWDFDGTIFDSYPHIAKAFCKMLDNHKKIYNFNDVINYLQISFDSAYKKYCLNENEITEFKNYSAQHNLEPLIKPYNDTQYILNYIIEHGGENYIFTHRDISTLNFYLEKYNLKHCFRDLITANNNFERKPSPEGINHIIKKYNLDKNNAVIIGDREIDVLSGINAGISSVLILRNNVSQTTANYVFKDLDSIKSLL